MRPAIEKTRQPDLRHCDAAQTAGGESMDGHSQSQLHTPGTRYRLTLDLVTLYTPLKNTSKHTCLDSLNLKPPAPLYPLQDFNALYKYCMIIIIITIWKFSPEMGTPVKVQHLCRSSQPPA